MRYILERVENTNRELEKHIYTVLGQVESYQMKDGHYLSIKEVDSSREKWREYKKNQLWGKKGSNHWFRTEIKLPKNKRSLALLISTGKGGWDAINPQFLIYINGKLIQGLDVNHREVLINKEFLVDEKIIIDIHAYAGTISDYETEIKNQLFTKLIRVNEEIKDLYYNIQVPLLILKKLDKESKIYIDILAILNETINLIDLRVIGSKEFNKSIREANGHILDKYYKNMAGHEEIIASCIGHTHIDIAWWWTVAQSRQKVSRSFSTVLKLMEEYPEYKFMSSQPVLYKFLLEDQPEVFEKVKEVVKRGRWEVEGGMWVEADTNVTSGESLVRQILFGTRFFKKHFNRENKILWLPDVFGYSVALPQILKKSDIDYFMTTKIAWNQYNKLPMDTFKWQGIDGSEVFTHFITTKDPSQDKKSHFTTYNGMLHPVAVIGAWERYQQKELNNDVLISYGYGDGGGGPTREMLEVGRRLEKGLLGVPKVKQKFARRYFEEVEKRVEGHKRLPKWIGELYLEYHRGTYTSMARNKRSNRKSEFMLQDIELLNSITMLDGDKYDKEGIDKRWEKVLLNQFHDIISGSSIKEVYDVTKKEYEEIKEWGERYLREKLDKIANKVMRDKKSLVVFNTLSHRRTDICRVEVDKKDYILKNQDESIIPNQVIEKDGKIYLCFIVKDLNPMGYRTYTLEEGVDESFKTMNINANLLENDYFKIELDENGSIKSIYDKREGREVVKEGHRANVIQAFEDKPMYYDNWDIDEFYTEKMWEVDSVDKVEVINDGSVLSTLCIKRTFLNSTIIQNIHIYSSIERIDFETYVDWKQSQILLKVVFPVDIHINKATYDIQYGNVERNTHKNTSWDQAKFEVCAHKWADLSEGAYGVSLMNDCKYGYDIIEGNIRLTLLKSGIVPNPVTDQEEHYFTYSLYPHSGDWKEAKTSNKAFDLNVPLYASIVEGNGGEKSKEYSLVSSNCGNIIIDTVKKAEETDELIIRFYENENKRCKVNLTFGINLKEVREVNLIERDLGLISELGSNSIEVEVKPYEIKTLKVKY